MGNGSNWQKPHDRKRGHRFSRAGRADDTKCFTFIEAKGNAIHRSGRVASRIEIEDQVVDFEYFAHGLSLSSFVTISTNGFDQTQRCLTL